MGYRFNDNPPKPEDHLYRFAVRNGATARITFGCYYLGKHDPKLHDFIGWPNPDNVDAICQEISNFKLFGKKNKTIELQEIHLAEEGYDEVAVAYEDSEYAQYLITESHIDEDDDNIIRVKVTANLPEFSDKPIDVKFTVFARKSSETRIDAVCHAIISVLPGPVYPGSVYPES